MENCNHRYTWIDSLGSEHCFQCGQVVVQRLTARPKVILTLIKGGKADQRADEPTEDQLDDSSATGRFD